MDFMKIREKPKSNDLTNASGSFKNLKNLFKWLDPFTYIDVFVLPKINPEKKSWISWTVYLISAFVFAFLLYSIIGFILQTSFPLVIVVSGSMEPVYFRGDLIVLQGTNPESLNAPLITLSSQSIHWTSYCIKKNEPEKEILCSQAKQELLLTDLRTSDIVTTRLVFDGNQIIKIQSLGDVIVYFSDLQGNKPVIHRAVAKIKTADGMFVLTKGDSVFNPLIDQESGISFSPIPVSELKGKTLFRIPWLGYLKLILIDDLQVLLLGCRQAEGCILP
ncbi:MAG: hypothetical protein Q7S92_01350 [Candidatus Diapherotrites archaeon]|nr:hypothetical protein [Candidatus Diapherotrites archaeon]